MSKSIRNFFVAIGLACYVTTGSVALAKNTESWLAPVCYHDLPEYGNYRWNCLVPPPPVPDDYPTSFIANEIDIALPDYAAAPELGSPPIPSETVVADVPAESVSPSNAIPVEQPAYFSATDIRRRDWWTPTFVVTDSPLVTPPVVDESCHTEWTGCEEESIDSFAELENAFFESNPEIAGGDSASMCEEQAGGSATSAAIPAECMAELMATEWSRIQDLLELAANFELSTFADYAAVAIRSTAPWFIAKKSETAFDIAKSEDALADELFTSSDSSFDEEQQATGFTAYTCVMPFSLTASAEESPANYAEQGSVVPEAIDDRVESAAAMQKLARQLDWVGLNILRVADHLDSWANQALLRHRADQVR
jgi:hypothetical protein